MTTTVVVLKTNDFWSLGFVTKQEVGRGQYTAQHGNSIWDMFRVDGHWELKNPRPIKKVQPVVVRETTRKIDTTIERGTSFHNQVVIQDGKSFVTTVIEEDGKWYTNGGLEVSQVGGSSSPVWEVTTKKVTNRKAFSWNTKPQDDEPLPEKSFVWNSDRTDGLFLLIAREGDKIVGYVEQGRRSQGMLNKFVLVKDGTELRIDQEASVREGRLWLLKHRKDGTPYTWKVREVRR